MAGCIFCGTSPTTNAHLFRKAWIAQLFPTSYKYRHSRDSLTVPKDEREWWTADVADIKVNAACSRCNGGWMNDLDHAAEDLFLTKAALGFDARLALMSEKETIARWLSLVVCLSDQTSTSPRLPLRIHDAVHDGRVPDEMHAWLYATDAPSDPNGPGIANTLWGANRHFTVSSDIAEPVDVLVVTFCINRLVAQVSVVTDAGPDKAFLVRSLDGYARQLWPPPLMLFSWPPPSTLTWDEALALPGDVDEFVQQVKAGNSNAVPGRRRWGIARPRPPGNHRR
jgi:hypothetical protein